MAALKIEADDASLKPAKRIYSGSNVGHMLRGLVALWEKDWTEAEKNFQKVLEASPMDFVARNNIALALVEQDDPAKKQRALTYAEINYRDQPNGNDASGTLAWVYFRRGAFDKAGLALDKAIKKATDPNPDLSNADSTTYVAHILHQRQRDWEAKVILEDILRSGRPFAMRPEAEQLYAKVKDAKQPEAAPAKTP